MTDPIGADEVYGDRLFNHANEGESRRLADLAHTFDPASRRHLAGLGIGIGWRCLEIGAGTGSMTAWMADRVGDDGQVVALDRDVSLLAGIDHPSVRVRQHDLEQEVELGLFDLVHARFVLMHLPWREWLLDRMIGWLRPGGVLVVSDMADLGTPSSPHPAYRDTLLTLWQILARTIGTDIDRGRDNPRLLRASELVDVDAAVDLPVVRGNSPWAEFIVRSIRQTGNDLVDVGEIDEDTVNSAVEYLRSADTWDLSVAMITTWGFRARYEPTDHGAVQRR